MPGVVPPLDATEARLDATDADVESPAEVAAQIPAASERPVGTAVVIPAVASRKRGALGRLLGDGKVKVPLAARCTALLVRGYVDLSVSGDVAWGVAPGSAESGPRTDLRSET
jgi:hypothetical protein